MLHGKWTLEVLVTVCVLCLGLAVVGSQAQPLHQTGEDWPMLAHDLGRSNATSNQVDPPCGPRRAEAVWVRDFASGDETSSELVFNQYQPVVVGGLVYVGTSRNNVYALDTETGEVVWVYEGEEPGEVVASPAVVDGVLYYACTNGHLYALDAQTGGLLWDAGIIEWGGFRTSPAVYGGSIYLGGEDGGFYAVNTADGAVRWVYETGAPVLNTAAVDVSRGWIYFANEEMYGFALDVNGELVWKSEKMQGISTRRFYPVIVDDGDAVIFRTSPGLALGVLNGGDTLMGRTAGLSIPNDYTHLRHGDEYGTDVYAVPGAGDVDREQEAIVNWLTDEHPEYETFYVLNTEDGSKRYVAPILWSGGSGEVGEPPVVAPDGSVYVRARSYWGTVDFDNTVYHFGTPAILDVDTGRLTLFTPPNHDPYYSGIFIIGDEASAMSLGGDRLYFYSHGDVVGSVLDSGASAGFVTVSRDIPHTVSGDERGQALPFGQDGLAHVRMMGGAGGGSSLFGQPAVIADDKVFYVSQGMIGMYKSGFSGGTDYIATSRGSQPPTGPVVIPEVPVLESYVTEIEGHAVDLLKASEVVAHLEEQVSDFVSGDRYEPFIQLAGKNLGYIHFLDPTEEAYILALAYPYLSASLKVEVRSHLDDLWAEYPDPLDAAIPHHDLSGRRRERYEINNDAGQIAAQRGSDYVTDASERLYHLWGYAYYVGDWDLIVNHWSGISEAAHAIDPNTIESGSFPNRSVNRQVASLIGYARMADHLRALYPSEPAYQTEYEWAVDAAAVALRSRLQWEENHRPVGSPWSRDWMQEGGGDDVFLETGWSAGGQISRYNGLVPAIARVLRDYAWEDMELQNDFVDTVIPAQHMAWSFIPNRGEIFSNLLPQSREVFLAKALIMAKDADVLRGYLGYPWCKGDLYYIERLVYTIRTFGPPPAGKLVSSSVADQGDVLTYTIIALGTGMPMTITDRLPVALSYIDGSAQYIPMVGALTFTTIPSDTLMLTELMWQGVLSENMALYISFAATVDVAGPQAIINTALMDDGSEFHEYSVTVITGGFPVYMPLILRD